MEPGCGSPRPSTDKKPGSHMLTMGPLRQRGRSGRGEVLRAGRDVNITAEFDEEFHDVSCSLKIGRVAQVEHSRSVKTVFGKYCLDRSTRDVRQEVCAEVWVDSGVE